MYIWKNNSLLVNIPIHQSGSSKYPYPPEPSIEELTIIRNYDKITALDISVYKLCQAIGFPI